MHMEVISVSSNHQLLPSDGCLAYAELAVWSQSILQWTGVYITTVGTNWAPYW